MIQVNLYIAREYIPRELFGHNLPNRIFPKRYFSFIKELNGKFEVNRFNDIASLAKFWFDRIGDEQSDDSPISDRLPENYTNSRLAKLSAEEFANFCAYFIKEVGPEIFLP